MPVPFDVYLSNNQLSDAIQEYCIRHSLLPKPLDGIRFTTITSEVLMHVTDKDDKLFIFRGHLE